MTSLKINPKGRQKSKARIIAKDSAVLSPFDNLTLKQKKFINGLAQGKTQKQAALDAGYSPKWVDS
ncbi:unnamed protein product, partial [marine sediment metagenome]